MLIYATLKPSLIEEELEFLIKSDNADGLRAFSVGVEDAFKELKGWALSNAGIYVYNLSNLVCLEVPMDKVQELPRIVSKYDDSANLKFVVGLGMTPSESLKTCLYAEGSNETVVMFNEDVEKRFNEDEYIFEKAENEGEVQHNIDLPNLQLEDSKEESSSSSKDEAPKQEPQSVKQKVLDALMVVKQKAPEIQKLKETNPPAYKAVKDLVDAMILMATKGVE